MPEVEEVEWWAPGRVNLIGEHTDYNGGLALPFAIDMGVTARVAAVDDPRVTVASVQEPDRVSVAWPDLEPGGEGSWSGYPLGVAWALAAQGAPRCGLDIGLDGGVPAGAGLSSSAAVTCSVAGALNDLWSLGLSRPELVAVARRAENDFVGAPTGGMDQMASLLGREGHALLVDNRSGETSQVPFEPAAAGLDLVVTDSRSRHRHADGGYRRVVDACRRAAANAGVTSLREIDVEDLPAALRRMGDDTEAAGALRHIVTENARVEQTVGFLERGEVEAIGVLLDRSGDSLRTDLRITTDEIDLAVRTARRAGALGARITGGGFGGCIISLVAADGVGRLTDAVSQAYSGAGLGPPRHWVVAPSRGAHRLDEAPRSGRGGEGTAGGSGAPGRNCSRETVREYRTGPGHVQVRVSY